MARLPAYEGIGRIDTGAQFMRQISAPTAAARGAEAFGAALSGLGRTLGQLGVDRLEKSQQLAERAKAADAIMRFTEFEREEVGRLREAQENIPVTGENFHANFMEEHGKRAQAFYDSLDEDMRIKLTPQVASLVSDFDDKSYAAQQRRALEHTTEALERTSKSAYEKVLAGGDLNFARESVYATIDTLGLPPNRAAEAKSIADRNLDAAYVQRLIDTNPVQAEKELRDQALGTPTGLDTYKRIAYDAATRHGHDPQLMLMVAGAESDFNPTLTNKHSTAYGTYQFIDGDWAETGIPKTSDPALQNEAMARRMSLLKSALQRNGLELTPSAVYGSHFMGRAGFVHVAKADPNANFFETYAQVAGTKIAVKAIKGNSRLMGDGTLTNAEVLARVANYATKRWNDAGRFLAEREKFDPDAKATVGGVELRGLSRGELGKYLTAASKTVTAAVTDEAKETSRQVKELAKADGLNVIPNSFDAEFRKTADDAFKSEGMHDRLIANDEGAFEEAVQFADKFGFVPKTASAAVQYMIEKGDEASRERGFTLAAKIHAADPVRGLDHSSMAPEIKRDVERYTAWLATDVEPREAIARVFKERENMAKNATTQMNADIKDLRNRRTWREVERIDFEDVGKKNFRDKNWFGFTTADRRPADDQTRDYITEVYRDRFEFHYRSGVSEEQAVRSAQQDIRRSFNTTKLFGRETNVLYPPEKIYPPVEGGHKYVERQALERVQSFVADYNKRNVGREISVEEPSEQVFLRPTARTASEYVSNAQGGTYKPPALDLWIVDNAGRYHGPMEFRPNAELEASRTKEAKEEIDKTATKTSTRSSLMEEARKQAKADEAEEARKMEDPSAGLFDHMTKK